MVQLTTMIGQFTLPKPTVEQKVNQNIESPSINNDNISIEERLNTIVDIPDALINWNTQAFDFFFPTPEYQDLKNEDEANAAAARRWVHTYFRDAILHKKAVFDLNDYQKVVTVATEVLPWEALKMLESNIEYNRSTRKRGITRYTQDMENDKFILCPACIAFSYDGKLIDGQNRLESLCKYGKGIKLRLHFGYPECIALGVDQGIIRKLDDLIRFNKHSKKHVTTAATIVRTISNYQAALNNHTSINIAKKDNIVSNNTLLDIIIKKHGPMIFESAEFAETIKSNIIPKHICAFAYFMLVMEDRTKGIKFMNALMKGHFDNDQPILTNSPLFVLRKNLIDKKLSPTMKEKDINMFYYISILRAWKMFKRDGTVSAHSERIAYFAKDEFPDPELYNITF